MKKYALYINGEFVESKTGRKIEVIDPSTGKAFAEVPEAGRNEVDMAVDAAREAFDRGTWSALPPSERARVFFKLADIMESRLQEYASMESRMSGKSIKQSTNYDIPYTIDNIRFYAGAARLLEGKAMNEYVPEGTSAIRRDPIGVVAVITPWNYPLMEVVWRAVPAMLVGNTVVVKPASYTPLTTLMLAEDLQKAGLPKGVFNVVVGPGGEVGEYLAGHPRVDMIAFTGSTEVGRRLMAIGSETLKKVSLELGGKAPFIVFDDADIDAAIQGAVVGGLVNNGQDCANSTRYYVHRDVYEKFLKGLVEELKKVRIGDPMDPSTDMGPLISASHRERVEGYIKKGIEEGGRLVYGGRRPTIRGHEDGYYLEPTVIETENQKSAIVQEEIFGPVWTVLKFETYQEAIEKANDVIYGLGASVWTKDVQRAVRATRDLKFATVWINEHVVVPSEMPWPSYKQSGTGASLSTYGLEEYTYIKHVYFDISGKRRKSWYYQVYGEP
ncbi:MAG: aldehyde dehydrogenase family protein [Nitrososphaeria archaeon]